MKIFGRKAQSSLVAHTILVAFSMILIIVILNSLSSIKEEYQDFIGNIEIKEVCHRISSAIDKIYDEPSYWSLTNLQTMKNTLSVSLRRGTATDLLDSITCYDSSWNHSDVSSYPARLGLKTDMYRFFVLVNNSQDYLKNQSGNLADLTNELVEINKTAFGLDFDENSILVLDEDGNSMSYNISGDMIILKG